jgi:protein-S-isoprenylcysteine O-methyltransferase Ste14
MPLLEIEKTMWFCTGVYWLFAAFNVKKSLKKQSDFQRIVYMCLWIVAFLLLFTSDISLPVLYKPVLLQQQYFKIAGLVLCLSGLLFSIRARIVLGKNWSGRIAIKQEHKLIQNGPYALSRNPIYTGFLMAFTGCALTEGLLKSYLSLLFITTGIFIKIIKEENYMHEVFSDQFDIYKKRVKRLLPFIY